jgi:hypothetical protein
MSQPMTSRISVSTNKCGLVSVHNWWRQSSKYALLVRWFQNTALAVCFAHRQRATRNQTEALIGLNWTPAWEMESEQHATVTHSNSVLEESTSAAGAEFISAYPGSSVNTCNASSKPTSIRIVRITGPWRMIMDPVIHMPNKQQVHDRAHKSWSFHFTLIKSNPVDISTSCSYNTYFHIILPSTSRYNR